MPNYDFTSSSVGSVYVSTPTTYQDAANGIGTKTTSATLRIAINNIGDVKNEIDSSESFISFNFSSFGGQSQPFSFIQSHLRADFRT